MYIIRTKINGFNYFLGTFEGKDKPYSVWEGIQQNGKKFKTKHDASDFAFAETTLECEIINV